MTLTIRQTTVHSVTVSFPHSSFYMCRSLVLQAYLLLSCIMSVALVNSSAVVYQQVFAVTIAALVSMRKS